MSTMNQKKGNEDRNRVMKKDGKRYGIDFKYCPSLMYENNSSEQYKQYIIAAQYLKNLEASNQTHPFNWK